MVASCWFLVCVCVCVELAQMHKRIIDVGLINSGNKKCVLRRHLGAPALDWMVATKRLSSDVVTSRKSCATAENVSCSRHRVSRAVELPRKVSGRFLGTGSQHRRRDDDDNDECLVEKDKKKRKKKQRKNKRKREKSSFSSDKDDDDDE